jgi:hypothetical protein
MVIYILLIFPSLQSFYSDQTGQTGMCVQKLNLAILSSFILVLGLFLFLRTYAWFVHLSSQQVEIMFSGRPSIQYYEKRKKSHRDLDSSEGSSRNPPLRRSTRAGAHRDLPRGSMDIDMEIEEEEHIVESSDDDDVEDESYMISLRATRESVLDDDDDENMDDANEIEDELRRQVEEEEEEGAEGIANPQQ